MYVCVCVYVHIYYSVCVCVCMYKFLAGKSHGQRSLRATILRVSRVGHNSVTKPPHIYILYQIFYIHLSADGHLDCFHVLATVNS